MASSVTELKDAVKATLEQRGTWDKLRARVRSEVFGALLAAEDAPRPAPCEETALINELLREFLLFNGCRDTLSVFLAESGQPQVRPFDREFLANKLRLPETAETQQVPLLYHLVARSQQEQQPAQQQPAAAGRLALPAAAQQQQHEEQQRPHAGAGGKRRHPGLMSPDATVD